MQALYLVRTGKLEWRDTPAPQLEGPLEALVRPLAVARCDLDAAILRGEAPFRGRVRHFLRDHLPARLGQRGLFRNAPFQGPYAFGHECVAEVLAVAADVQSVRVGDRVIVPFQISCGRCERCLRGLTASCSGVPARSSYGLGALGGHAWGGVVSDVVRVPFADAMLVPLPAGLSASSVASLGDNVVDGYRTVAGPLCVRPQASVLAVGGGAPSVGLYAAGVAVALGASEVDYLDHDPTRLRIAESLGARVIESPRRAKRYAISVDASADPRGLATALKSLEPGGLCTSVGIYYTPTSPVPLLGMYGTGVTLVTGRVQARRELPDLLALMAATGFDPARVTTRYAAWNDAHDAFLDPGPKVVVARS